MRSQARGRPFAMKQILVGIDFSDSSDLALLQARALAVQLDASLTLLHSTGMTDAGQQVYEEGKNAGASWTTYVKQRLDHARGELEARRARCEAEGIKTTTRMVAGYADAAMVSMGHELEADFIVVGTHGRRGRDRWLFGSVAGNVVRLSRRNVWVAREATPPIGRPSRVMVATDFSPTADSGVRAALALSKPDALVDVVHCWRVGFDFGLPPPLPLLDEMRERALENGTRLLAEYADSGRHVRFDMIDGEPVEGILARLADGDHDMLVIGSHGRRGVGRLLLGSVAESLVRRATHSVLVVHGAGAHTGTST
jgi:nucleotide-binding universal stress UspA family protein